MIRRIRLALFFLATLFILPDGHAPAPACCPAGPRGRAVVNADQTVIIIWDAATKTQHLIRKASFKSDADDFAFLIPTPSQPALEESGNAAFPYLQQLTAPEVKKGPAKKDGLKSRTPPKSAAPSVKVLEEKLVAGFDAVVLETQSATALIEWLKGRGYVFSPEVEAWAKPYVEQGWKITALKVAKNKDGTNKKDVAASALRLTFKTDRPLFPYREPDSNQAAQTLGANRRLLRIYLLAEARYDAERFLGKAVWANPLAAEQRAQVLRLLKLPQTTGPAEWWLTEFEHTWPYRVAAGDVYFARSASQQSIRRPAVIGLDSSLRFGVAELVRARGPEVSRLQLPEQAP